LYQRHGIAACYLTAVDLSSLGKIIVLLGLGLVAFGLLVVAAGKGIIPRLPGDISFQVGGVRVLFPIVTSIVLSVVLTVVISLISRR
jgi:hypothetical protein